MNINIDKLMSVAEQALHDESVPRSGGWMRRHTRRSAYRGAPFNFNNEYWIACRGNQRPDYARLLDATAAYMKESNAAKGICFLEPPLPQNRSRNSIEASREYLRRLQSAVWIGCNIVWITTDGDFSRSWDGCSSFCFGDLDDIVKEIENDLSDLHDLNSIVKSHDAERLILPRLLEILNSFGFRQNKDKAFQDCWRKAIPDGLWVRSNTNPHTLAIEVKVSEDIEAPLCQIITDIAQYDAALCIRCITEQNKTAISQRHESQKATMEYLKNVLPIRFIELQNI